MQTEIDARCPVKTSITGVVCGGPLVYNPEYDTYKCQLHNHYAISREEFERRHRIAMGLLTQEEQRIIDGGLYCPYHDDAITRLVSESHPWNGKVCCWCGRELIKREEAKDKKEAVK